MSIQSYDIQIPAGGAQTLEAGGQIFDFLSSGSAFDQIQVLPEFQQGNVTLKQGQGFDAGKVVNRWYVKNPGTTAINGTVVLSTAGFRNFRISGDVNVLDGGKSRTIANQAFSVYGGVTAVAAQYSRMQLWNPANSGVRLILEALEFLDGPVANSVSILFQGAALATVVGNGIAKLAGGTAAKGQLNSDTTAAAPAGNFSFALGTPASTNLQFSPKEPVVIPPGWGLTFWGNTQNAYFGMQMEWYEEPNT
ncbi:hypothetical protein WL10_13505 [Burkholderia ubonensis]|uniref:hypothetical protein n=1 Tax=Burkholderia ubonensis TaxID=101571 RepID=UPI000760499E|nr:hypothetical protein [Burkholderia ubonensis]KVX90844.1 hypothetical protein WL10_13505 [Burkholderia ubonensis]